MKNKTFPIFLAFLAMGFGDAVGPFVGLAKEQFSLSNFEAQLIAFMGFVMFGLLSIPVGVIQDRKGKKFILMLGLSIAMLGMVIPLFGFGHYALFLVTILLLGSGAAILQVSGNPIMRDVSLPGTYARNLSFGQFIKAIGSLSGSLIPFIAARWFNVGWEILFPIYSSALLLTIVIVGFTRIEEQKKEANTATLLSCLKLLKYRSINLMVLAIFIYVGIEVSMSTGVPILLNTNFGVDLKTWGILGNAFFFISILLGRFTGSIVLNWIKPGTFLRISVLTAMLGLILLFNKELYTSLTGIFITGIGFSNIFPLIFSITVDKNPDRANEISGLMITAIVGGAFIPPVMGYVADAWSVTGSFCVPLFGLIYLSFIAFRRLSPSNL